MNKRGVAFVFGLIAVTVLSVLAVTYFMRTMNQNNWVKREISTWRAFWAAESGAAAAIAALPSTTSLADTLDGGSYATTTELLSSIPGQEIYLVNATGTVGIPGAGSIDKKVGIYICLQPPNPDNFDYSLEVNGELKLGGAAHVWKDLDEDGVLDPGEEGEDISYNTEANLSFANKIGLASEEVEEAASVDGVLTTLSTGPSHQQDVPDDVTDTIHWINMEDPVTQARVPKTGWYGSGILIVNGELQMEGGVFEGIIWVIGKLTISGNAEIRGAIFAECETSVQTSITGTPDIKYDAQAIADALELLNEFAPRSIKAWREVQ